MNDNQPTNDTETTKCIQYSEETLMEISLLQRKMQDSNWESIDYWRTPIHSAAESGITSRVINYWVENGLMTDNRDNEQGWHKFSLMDILFITIANELRAFGFSIKQLQQTHQSLFAPLFNPNDGTIQNPEKYFSRTMTVLEFGFLRTIYFENDGNTYLLVANDGSAGIMTYRDLKKNQEEDSLPVSFMFMELNTVFGRAFTNKKIKRWSENIHVLNNTEKAVIDKIRESNKKRTIEISTLGAGIVDRLDIKESIEVNGNLHKIIGGIQHGKLELCVQNGHPYCIKKKETIKAKNAK